LLETLREIFCVRKSYLEGYFLDAAVFLRYHFGCVPDLYFPDQFDRGDYNPSFSNCCLYCETSMFLEPLVAEFGVYAIIQ